MAHHSNRFHNQVNSKKYQKISRLISGKDTKMEGTKMIIKRGKGDYPRIYRPARVSELYGLEEIKRVLGNGLDNGTLPHSMLFHGIFGTGKTTCARIVGAGLLCDKGTTSEPCCECELCKDMLGGHCMDFIELNNADMTGIDDMRSFRDHFVSSTWKGPYKIFVFDECHQMSKYTQSMLLKVVENSHLENYFIFCSTSLQGIIEPLQSRCVSFKFEEHTPDEIKRLLEDVCKWERIKYQDKVLNSIVEQAKGKPRNALFLLQKAVGSEKVEKIEHGKIYSIGEKKESNTLFIAPHGVHHDDDYTGLISKHLSDHLEGYGVINEKYQKPETIGLKEPDLLKDIANVNRFNQIDQNEELKEDFLGPILKFKRDILKNNDHASIFHIHGISDDHIHRAAETIEEYKNNPEKLHVLIGYGQREDDKELLTADEETIVQPLIEYLKENDINAAIAPTMPIMGNDGEEKIYCGSDPNGLNQRLCEPKKKVQSIQLEIKKSGFRENEEQAIKTADRLGMALSKIVKTELNPDLENKKVSTDNITPTEDHACKIETRKISSLKSHPLNQQIYGDSDPDDDMKTSIQQNGILTPLLISDDDRILSGHRRYACAEELDIKAVPVIVTLLKNELDIEEAVINANIQRQKTKEQIAREYMKLKEIEREKAKQRQAEAGGNRKSDESKKSLTQNSAEAVSKGESRKKASSKLGISHDTGEKAAKVVLMADDLKKAGKMEEARSLLNTLNNKSVNKAHKEAQTIEGSIVIPKEKGKPTFNKTNENIEWANRIAEEKRKARKPKKIKTKRKTSLFTAVKHPETFFSDDMNEEWDFDKLVEFDSEQLNLLKENASKSVETLEEEKKRLEESVKKYEMMIEKYGMFTYWLGATEHWQKKLRARETGKEKVEIIKETPLIKKLRNAVLFMCFWRGWKYADFYVEKFYKYVPLEELNESRLRFLLRSGKNDLQACWDFEVRKRDEKFKQLKKHQVQKRLEKGKYWLSKEKYDLLNDPNYYDYK